MIQGTTASCGDKMGGNRGLEEEEKGTEMRLGGTQGGRSRRKIL